MENWLKWRWLQFLGLISYSLYLIHNPITGAGFFLLKKKISTTVSNELMMLGAVVGICVASAFVMWLVVERPFIRLARRITLRSENLAATELSTATESSI